MEVKGFRSAGDAAREALEKLRMRLEERGQLGTETERPVVEAGKENTSGNVIRLRTNGPAEREMRRALMGGHPDRRHESRKR